MTEPTVEIPADNPSPKIPAPEVPHVRTAVIQMTFSTTDPAIDNVLYAAEMEHPHGLAAESYSKQLAEIVERTALLHLGALPVLSKVEAPAEVPA